MTADSLTLIDAIDLLRGRGWLVGVDPDPALPFLNYYLQSMHDVGVTFTGLTAASIRTYAAYGVFCPLLITQSS